MKTDFLPRLRNLLPSNSLSDDQTVIETHCRDYKGLNTGKALAVVYPKTTAEVEAVVALCGTEAVKIVPQGGNTSGYGGAVPDRSGDTIVMSMSRMNRILDIDLENNTVTVEPGVVLGELNRKLAEIGRWFPLSFGSEDSCQIGGNIAMNSGGNTVMRYGMVRENVLGLEAVLGNGAVFSNTRPLRKKCVGYDIGQILIGSEGTLGVVTKAVLKLQPLMTATITAWLSCGSLELALKTLSRLREGAGDRLTSFEVMSKRQREIITTYQSTLVDPMDEDYEWAIIAELKDTTNDEELRATSENALADALESGLITNAIIASNEAQRRAFWLIREAVLDANKACGWPVSHDASVPVSKLPLFAERVETEVGKRFPESRFIAAGHAGDGNIHLGMIFEKTAFKNIDEYKATGREINAMVFDIADDLGGHFASEHGIGVLHLDAFRRYIPPRTVQLMEQIKAVLDPANIMNPGKIFRTETPSVETESPGVAS